MRSMIFYWHRPVFILLAVVPMLSSCSTMRQEIDEQTSQALSRARQDNAQLTVQQVSDKPIVQRVNSAWLGSRAIPIQVDMNLPEIFWRADFRFQFGKGTLTTIAEKLTQVIHIPVRVEPDVFMSASALLSTGQTNNPIEGNDERSNSTPLTTLPNPMASSRLSTDLPNLSTTSTTPQYEMNYWGTLAGYLEQLCARAGISWDYHDGVITLKRLVTRTFTLKAIPGSSAFDATLGRDAQTQAGAQGGSSGASGGTGNYASAAKVKMDSTYSVWTALEKAIQTIKTPVGRYAISEATGTITITDTSAAVAEVARLIDHENSLLTRQIAMRVEVLSVKIVNSEDYGIDWGLVFQQVAALTPWAVSFSTPASMVSPDAAHLGVSILSRKDGQPGPWSGSKAFFQALAQYGRVKVVTTANALTVNRQPIPVAITQQTGYLAEVTPAPAGANGNVGGTPGLKPGTVTTGFMLNLLPTVLDSNQLLLQFSVGISSLDALNKQTSGSGSNQQSIQTPMISSTDFLQKVAMRPGETLVLSGYERQAGQYDRRTLGQGTPIGLGGGFNGNQSREAVVILVTPVLIESAI